MLFLSIGHNGGRKPSRSVYLHSPISIRVFLIILPFVYTVFGPCSLSQIFKSIVSSIKIIMVHFILRPFPRHVQPRNPTSLIVPAVNRQTTISLLTYFPSPVALSYARRSWIFPG